MLEKIVPPSEQNYSNTKGTFRRIDPRMASVSKF